MRLDDQLGLERELSTFLSKHICAEREMQIAVKALEDAYSHKRRAIKETLARQGLLQVFHLLIKLLIKFAVHWLPKGEAHRRSNPRTWRNYVRSVQGAIACEY